MTEINWTIMGVVITGVGVLVAIVIGIWQVWKKKGKRKKKTKPTMTQSVKQEVHVHNIISDGKEMPSKLSTSTGESKSKKPQKEKRVESSSKPTVVTLLDERISIPNNSNVKRDFDLKYGDRIKGSAEDIWGRNFSIYVMNEENYHEYQNGEDYQCEREYEDVVQTHIFVDIPYDDTWYIVFDTAYKQVDRKVKVKLQKKSK